VGEWGATRREYAISPVEGGLTYVRLGWAGMDWRPADGCHFEAQEGDVELHEGGTFLLDGPREHPGLLTGRVCKKRGYKLQE